MEYKYPTKEQADAVVLADGLTNFMARASLYPNETLEMAVERLLEVHGYEDFADERVFLEHAMDYIRLKKEERN